MAPDITNPPIKVSPYRCWPFTRNPHDPPLVSVPLFEVETGPTQPLTRPAPSTGHSRECLPCPPLINVFRGANGADELKEGKSSSRSLLIPSIVILYRHIQCTSPPPSPWLLTHTRPVRPPSDLYLFSGQSPVHLLAPTCVSSVGAVQKLTPGRFHFTNFLPQAALGFIDC